MNGCSSIIVGCVHSNLPSLRSHLSCQAYFSCKIRFNERGIYDSMVNGSVDDFVYIPLLSCQRIFIVRDIVEYQVLARCLLDRIFNGLESTFRVGRLSDTSKRMVDQYLQISYVLVNFPLPYNSMKKKKKNEEIEFYGSLFSFKISTGTRFWSIRALPSFILGSVLNIDRISLCVWITQIRILISGCTIDIFFFLI